jgi:hypothetical protein
LSFIPAFGRRDVSVVFHSSRPLIIVRYIEEPVPWVRVLVYGFKSQAVRIVFNSSYFYRHKYISNDILSDHLLLHFHKRAGGLYRMLPLIKLYDFSKGMFTGHVNIPPDERCLHNMMGDRGGRHYVFEELCLWAISCITNTALFFLTTYTYVPRNKVKGELEFLLSKNSSRIIYLERNIRKFSFSYIRGRDAASFNFYRNYTLKFTIYRNMHQRLSTVQNPLRLLTANTCRLMNKRLGFFFCFWRYQSSEFVGVEISSFSRPLSAKKCHMFRKWKIQISGSIIHFDRNYQTVQLSKNRQIRNIYRQHTYRNQFAVLEYKPG